jgi:tRNA-specific 2-thiouridylase
MEKPDSQEICFIPSNDHGTFLEKEFEAKKEPGNIRTREGKILGTHTGYYQYTRGQRRGLGVAFKERLYVLETVPEKNEVVVGTKEEVLDSSFVVRRMNWFLKPWEKEGEAYSSIRAFVKIRSQHKKVPAWIEIVSEDEAFVTFETPQEAVTPGQAAVFYDGRRVLGGGWIG